ncbi:MAG: hypothetical protein ACI9LY_002749 [Arenicella sp.]
MNSGSKLQGVKLSNQFIETHRPIVGDENSLSLLEAQQSAAKVIDANTDRIMRLFD